MNAMLNTGNILEASEAMKTVRTARTNRHYIWLTYHAIEIATLQGCHTPATPSQIAL